MILVTEATETVGRELIDQLAREGAQVRGLTRHPEAAKVPPTVDVVANDLSSPDKLMPAMRGVEQIFLVSRGDDRARLERNVVWAAVAGRVTRIVKLSALTVGARKDVITGWHEDSERAVRASGLAWTFLRPGEFMSNALAWAGMIKYQGGIFAPFTEVKTAAIDPADVAGVAATVLTRGGHEGRAYPLSGPELISPAEQAELIATATGHPVPVTDITPASARERMIQAGTPPEIADAVLTMQETAGDWPGGEIFPTVAEITGRPAASFGAWLDRHRDAFSQGHQPGAALRAEPKTRRAVSFVASGRDMPDLRNRKGLCPAGNPA
jgi:uncharacterized protein YbjT (DUF2867 family)